MREAKRFCAVIMCGGSGTRLWPLSRRDTPKQFTVEIDGKSLFERTYERVSTHHDVDRIVCVTHNNHGFDVQSLTGKSCKNVIILEPVSRNTAATIASAALFTAQEDPSIVLACLPADHEIVETMAFHDSLSKAVRVAADGWLTILSVVPRAASTAFGYLLPGEQLSDDAFARRLQIFIEKPDGDRATKLAQSGYHWNSGMVVARADVLLDALQRHVPDVLASCRAALFDAQHECGSISLDLRSFATCRNISFDHAVLEKHDRIAVVELNARWSDVGSWNEFAGFQHPDDDDNRIIGEVEARACNGSFIFSPDRLTVALGIKNMVVVSTDDALLVAERSELGSLKGVVESMLEAERAEATNQSCGVRPLGARKRVERGDGFQLKHITIRAGEALSLQYHTHRSKHWVVVRGQAFVTCDGKSFCLNENESTFIPKDAVHRLKNNGTGTLELIEVICETHLSADGARKHQPFRDNTT